MSELGNVLSRSKVGKAESKVIQDGTHVHLMTSRCGQQFTGSRMDPDIARATIKALQQYLDMDDALFDLAKSFYDQITDGDGYTHSKSEIKNLVDAGYIKCDENGYCETTDKFHQRLVQA